MRFDMRFVGVAQGDLPHRDLRLAEGILHECMHLQLTLIEEQTPLLATETERHLSPWRQTLRPTRGILHGLYVFRVIQDVFAELILHEGLADNERRYMSRRVDEINDEVAQLLDLSFSQDLTATGSALAKRLLVGNRSSARQLIGRMKSAN
jgi:HEXXH motif-containing protein